jgi:hypothetical protein
MINLWLQEEGVEPAAIADGRRRRQAAPAQSRRRVGRTRFPLSGSPDSKIRAGQQV